MGGDVFRDIFMSLLLVTDMNESVVDTHFEFCWRFVSAALIFIKFFQALKSWKSGISNVFRAQKMIYTLFISCCSSNGIENPALSRSK